MNSWIGGVSFRLRRNVYKEKRAKPNLYYVTFMHVRIRVLTNL